MRAKIKKFLSVFLCFVLVLPMIFARGIEADAAGTAHNVGMTVDKETVEVGDVITVTLSLNECDLSTLVTSVLYDPAYFECIGMVGKDENKPKKITVTYVDEYNDPIEKTLSGEYNNTTGSASVYFSEVGDIHLAGQKVVFKAQLKAIAVGNTSVALLEDSDGDSGYYADGEVYKSIVCKAPSVAATDIKLDKTTITIDKGADAKVQATVTPSTSTDEVTWTVDKSDVAKIEADGNTCYVTGVAYGTAVLTATAGTKTATCEVKVECQHSQTEVITEIPATCTTKGHAGYTRCTICQAVIKGEDKEIDFKPHTFVNYPAITPTCLKPGNSEYNVCSECEGIFDASKTTKLDEIPTLPIAPHTLSKVDKVEPLCEKAGKKEYYKCSTPGCGKMFTDESATTEITDESQLVIPALGHDLNLATCTEPKTCKRCDYTEGTALGHDYENATCTAPKTCKVCGETDGEKLGHDFVPATCTEPKTCKRCNYTEGTALGHDYKDATCTEPKTCKVCGVTDGEALGHDFADATCQAPKTCKRCKITEGEKASHVYATWDNDETHHWKKCNNCEAVNDATKLEHVEGTAATCYSKAICQHCHAEYGEMKPHKTDLVKAKEPSCTTKGNIAYYVCLNEGCGKYFEDAEATKEIADKTKVVLAALGHDFAAATCTEPKTCKVCKVTEGEALGHDFASATCTEPESCTRCDETRGEALGHDFTKWACDDENHWNICSRCDEKNPETVEAHVEKTAATCVEKAVCEICEFAYGPYAAHTLKEVKALAPECEKKGNIAYYVCTYDKCDKYFEDADATKEITDKTKVEVAALGHEFAEATCTEPKTCKVCKVTEGEALGHKYTVAAYDENSHWLSCEVCKEKDADSVKEHTYTTDTDETCDECEHIRKVTPVVIEEKRMETYEVPKALVEKGIDTVEKIQKKILETVLATKVTVEDKKIEFKAENTQIIDIQLTYNNSELKNDTKYTIYVPYPKGTDAKTHTYRIIHMIDEGALAGTLEVFDAASGNMACTEKGIEITVTGASPFAISYAAIEAEEETPAPEPEKPTPTPEPEKPTPAPEQQTPTEPVAETPVTQPVLDQSPKTDDLDYAFIWLVIAGFAACFGMGAFVLNKKKEH